MVFEDSLIRQVESNAELVAFQQTLANTEQEQEELSNLIEVWDAVPIYFMSRQAQTKKRSKEGFLPLLSRSFVYKKREHIVDIVPAQLLVNGTPKMFYPSAREELLEGVLRKLALDQRLGFMDVNQSRTSGVFFTIYMIRQEMKLRGHSLSFDQIIESLKIMSGCIIEIRTADGNKMTRGPILPQLVAVSLATIHKDPKAKWFAQFNALVTEQIIAKNYRQFSYASLMLLKTSLSRWIFRRLSLMFINASMLQGYHLLHTTIKRDSCLLENYSRLRDEYVKVQQALDELQQIGVVRDVEMEEFRGKNRKLLDIKYVIKPSALFIKNMKCANKRKQMTTDAE